MKKLIVLSLFGIYFLTAFIIVIYSILHPWDNRYAILSFYFWMVGFISLSLLGAWLENEK